MLPVLLIPQLGHMFPANAWPAIAVFSLAAAAHQGWSCNLYSTASDIFPSSSVSSVIGIGGAAGAIGGAIFTWIVKSFFALHPLLIFIMAGLAYITSLAIFQWLVPRLGEKKQTLATTI